MDQLNICSNRVFLSEMGIVIRIFGDKWCYVFQKNCKKEQLIQSSFYKMWGVSYLSSSLAATAKVYQVKEIIKAINQTL